MKVTSVELQPQGSDSVVVLSFRNPTRALPYNVKAVMGLDADEIVPRYYGKGYYNLSLEKRDIVVRAELNPRYDLGDTVSGLRDNFYRMLSASRTGVIDVRFLNGTTVIAVVSGFASKFEAPHFNKNPEIQLTLSCDDPMLRAPQEVDIPVAGLNPGATTITDTLSTAPHGFKFAVGFSENRASFRIADPNDSNWFFEVTPAGGFLNGDVLHFSSDFNDKSLYITRGETTIHLADVITPGSVWPIIFPGDNTFAVASPTGVTWSAISHRPTYWGV